MKTSSFRLYTGPGRISIARYAPRGTPAGFRIFSGLAPGDWFNKVSQDDYIKLYTTEMLSRLDPQRTWDTLHDMANGHEPILLCYEVPPFTASNWCHRRMVAAFFHETLGVDVPELDIGTAPHAHRHVPRAPRDPPSHVVPRPGVEPDVPVVPQSWLDSRKERK